MIKHCLLWFMSLVLLGFLGLVEQEALAEQVLYVNNTLANVRSSPTAAAKNIIATVPQNTPVVVLMQQGKWYQVRLPDGREGWISSWVLSSPGTPPDTLGRGLSPVGETATMSRASEFSASMIYIAGGTGIVGSDENDIEYILQNPWGAERDALEDELPKQLFEFRGFYIDPYEVTNAQYKKFVDTTRYAPPPHWNNGIYPEGTADLPVTYVSWEDAQAYAQWAGKRLPTAEEWEIASRGVNGQLFPWGTNYITQYVNINSPHGGVARVGSYAEDRSVFGVYDLGGNVMEWTSSPYQDNPAIFIVKGGSWKSPAFEARGANKIPGYAEYRLDHIGFRCVKSEQID